MNTIPEQLFDYLENSSFAELKPEQQQEVLAIITESEYDDMRMVLALEKNHEPIAQPALNPTATEAIWNAVHPPLIRVVDHSKRYWQLAASLLLPLCIYFGLRAYQPTPTPKIVTRYDTLYLPAPIAPPPTVTKSETPSSLPKRITHTKKLVTTRKTTSSIKRDQYKSDADVVANDVDHHILRLADHPMKASNAAANRLTTVIGFNVAEKENIYQNNPPLY